MDVRTTIEKLGGIDAYACSIESAMRMIRPGCLYAITATSGRFILSEWPDNQWSDELQAYWSAPTEQEIRDEYIRQQTIGECLRYFKELRDGTLG